MIQFRESDHSYTSIVPDGIQWKSVTGIIHDLCEPFDKVAVATKCSTKRPGKYPNKWFGYSVDEILRIWDSENNRSTELGHWYHSKKENELYQSGIDNVCQPVMSNGVKIASSQKLTEGIYPEHIVYLQSAGICGQVDLPSVTAGILDITDHKTNKEIKTVGFTNWEGVTKKMLAPVNHLDDCEFNHYSLQLSMYAYMILQHNPSLKLGRLTIEHVKFEEAGKDKYGYPITKMIDGEPVVKSVEKINVPYLKAEVQSIIKWLKSK